MTIIKPSFFPFRFSTSSTFILFLFSLFIKLCDLRVIDNPSLVLNKSVQKALSITVEGGSCLYQFNQLYDSCTPEETTMEAMQEATVEACCYVMINNACIKRSLAATDPQCQSSLYNHQRDHNEKIETRCAAFGIKCAASTIFLQPFFLILTILQSITAALTIAIIAGAFDFYWF